MLSAVASACAPDTHSPASRDSTRGRGWCVVLGHETRICLTQFEIGLVRHASLAAERQRAVMRRGMGPEFALMAELRHGGDVFQYGRRAVSAEFDARVIPCVAWLFTSRHPCGPRTFSAAPSPGLASAARMI